MNMSVKFVRRFIASCVAQCILSLMASSCGGTAVPSPWSNVEPFVIAAGQCRIPEGETEPVWLERDNASTILHFSLTRTCEDTVCVYSVANDSSTKLFIELCDQSGRSRAQCSCSGEILFSMDAVDVRDRLEVTIRQESNGVVGDQRYVFDVR